MQLLLDERSKSSNRNAGMKSFDSPDGSLARYPREILPTPSTLPRLASTNQLLIFQIDEEAGYVAKWRCTFGENPVTIGDSWTFISVATPVFVEDGRRADREHNGLLRANPGSGLLQSLSQLWRGARTKVSDGF
ncbi:hypothetical protein KM043_011066 [Ampulex compressa]|nr:hypothetical protein KM043_011066 [Ampulex compressa]